LGNHPILKKIQGIAIPPHSKPDSFCWGLDNSDTFSTKSVTWIAYDKSINDSPDWNYKWIWKIDTMPKIKFFLWQLCHKAVPIRGMLLKRRLNIDAGCPICMGDIESIDHLLCECPIGKKVWELADKHHWFPIQFSPGGWQPLTEVLQRVRSYRKPQLLQKLSFLIWSIWKERNAVAFENKFFNPLKCLIKAKKVYAELRIRSCISDDSSLRGAPSSSSKPVHLIKWHPPPPGFVKINFDGSLLNSSAAGGYVLRDWTGKLLKIGVTNYGHSSIVVAEARAVKDGVSAAIQAGYRSLLIEGDNTTVIQALTG